MAIVKDDMRWAWDVHWLTREDLRWSVRRLVERGEISTAVILSILAWGGFFS